MTRRDDQRIADILDACRDLDDLGRLREEGSTPGWVLNRAAERLLEVIGEASGALSQQVRGRHPAVPWRDITRLRILLTHHYQRVDPEQVWQIVEGEIPRLAAALRA
jgi:uncharacterized protein with HEPN domain